MEPDSISRITTPALKSLVVQTWLIYDFLNLSFLIYRMGIIIHTFYDGVVERK